jgi:MoxR-like ATPase
LEPVIATDAILAMQRAVRRVRVEASIRDYIISLIRATRTHAAVELGASPRGSLYLYHGVQAFAALHGRDYVLPDDVKHLAPYIMTHRLIIGAQTRLRGRNAQQIVREIVDSVPVPVEQ